MTRGERLAASLVLFSTAGTVAASDVRLAAIVFSFLSAAVTAIALVLHLSTPPRSRSRMGGGHTMIPRDCVGILEGDFVVGAWHFEVDLSETPCTCGKCDLRRKKSTRTLVICRRASEYYMLDVREEGSEVVAIDVEVAATDEDVFTAWSERLTETTAEAMKDVGPLRIKSLRIFTADFAEIPKKLDAFMGVVTNTATVRIERRGGVS